MIEDKEYKIGKMSFTCEREVVDNVETLTLITEKVIDTGVVEIQIHLYTEDYTFHYTVNYFDKEGNYYLQNDEIGKVLTETEINECHEQLLEISREQPLKNTL